jgi:hypothetical protein
MGSKENDNESEKVTLDEYFKVVPGVMMEITLAPYWPTSKECVFDFEIQFHGVKATVSGSTNGNDKAIAGVGSGMFLNSGNTGKIVY